MKKKILILVFVLYFIIQPSLAIELKENKDFVCMDKGVTAVAPPRITTIEDKNFTVLCSPGNVPKAIYSQAQTQELSKIIKGFPNRTANNNKKMSVLADCSNYAACYNWAETMQYVASTGVSAILTQHDPSVAQNSYHSLAEIGISHNYASSWPGNYVETGWRKAANDVTRLFTFWWINGVGQCYNAGCAGWVQYSSKYYPGMPLSVDNNGIDYEIQYSNGDWWVWYNDEWIGYYPGSLWNGLFTEGDSVFYYGEVATYITNPETTTDMGNGFWASNQSAAEIKYPSFLNSSGWTLAGSTLEKYISSRNLYTLEPYFAPSDIIRYGGPGLDDFSSFIGLSSPNGETLDTGHTYEISWKYEGSVGPYVKIDLLNPDDTLVETLADAFDIGDAGNGWYWWDIPLLMTPGDYKIRVTSSSDSLKYWSENPVTIKLMGDIDGNDKITVADALLYLRYAVGQNISPYHIDISDDVTCDGKITVADALMVLRKSVGQNVSLQC